MNHNEVSAEMFGALINREMAYDYPVHMGLVKFSDSVEVVCEMTPLFLKFKEQVDIIALKGDTKLYDALVKGVDVLTDFKVCYYIFQSIFRSMFSVKVSLY